MCVRVCSRVRACVWAGTMVCIESKGQFARVDSLCEGPTNQIQVTRLSSKSFYPLSQPVSLYINPAWSPKAIGVSPSSGHLRTFITLSFPLCWFLGQSVNVCHIYIPVIRGREAGGGFNPEKKDRDMCAYAPSWFVDRNWWHDHSWQQQ